LVVFFLDAVLFWSEPKACRKWAARSSTNKGPLSMASGGQGGSWRLLFFTCHGDEVEEKLLAPAGGLPRKQQGSNEAAPGSTSTATLAWSSLFKVVRQPLPTSSSVTVPSGRRSQVINYLQLRRPLCISAVGSRRLTPSGIIPGVKRLDCAAMRRSGGSGVGLDCFCFPSFRVLGAKSLDWFVISFSFVVLHVIVVPPPNECF
jgi:hypothetical protein